MGQIIRFIKQSKGVLFEGGTDASKKTIWKKV